VRYTLLVRHSPAEVDAKEHHNSLCQQLMEIGAQVFTSYTPVYHSELRTRRPS